MDRKPKTVFQLDSPFTTAAWPQVSLQDQETILELLCNLLSPIGQHRANHLPRSKGKRSKKRKRQEGEKSAEPPIPPAPEISSFVCIGLNSITRALQEASQKPPGPASSPGCPPPEQEPSSIKSKSAARHPPAESGPPPSRPSFSAIFVLRSSQPPILHAHLPQLIATASRAPSRSSPDPAPATRLVQLPRGSDERVCRALGLPRASFIGLVDGAPHAAALVELVRSCVPEIKAPWLDEAQSAAYLPVKINAIETFAPVVKKQPVRAD